MNLAENGSEDETSTTAIKEAGTIPPGPADKVASTIQPKPAENEAGTTPPAATWIEAGMTPEKPINSKQKGTPKPDQPTTPSSGSGSSDDDDHDNQEDEYVSCFLEWLSLEPDCKGMLDNETKMLARHHRTMGNKAVLFFQQTLNKDSELYIETRAQITAAVYVICESILRLDSQLGNISYFTSGHGKGRQTMRVAGDTGCARSECFSVFHLSLWIFFGSTFVSVLWVYGLSVDSWFSF